MIIQDLKVCSERLKITILINFEEILHFLLKKFQIYNLREKYL